MADSSKPIQIASSEGPVHVYGTDGRLTIVESDGQVAVYDHGRLTIVPRAEGGPSFQITISPSPVLSNEGMIPFVAKVSFVRTRRGKDYTVARLTVPKETTKDLALKNEDYLFLKARIAAWFELVKWKEMRETWNKLPPRIQQQIVQSGLGPSDTSLPTSPSQGLSSGSTLARVTGSTTGQ